MQRTLVRLPLALVWLYQGLWCKLLDRTPHQAAIVAGLPYLNARVLLISIGAIECALAIWIIGGRYTRLTAMAQTVLLAVMNAGGLLFAANLIPDPVGMLLQNAAFLTLAWIVAGEPYARPA